MTVKEIFHSMDYGPAPEDAKPAQAPASPPKTARRRVERGGKGMLGGDPVVGQMHGPAGDLAQTRGEGRVGSGRAQDERAPVDVEQRRPVGAVGHARPDDPAGAGQPLNWPLLKS